jgi:ribosomal RNA-processing protein 1
LTFYGESSGEQKYELKIVKDMMDGRSVLIHHRMDKFLYLVRVYLHASFQHFAQRGWRDTERLDAYIDILSATPLEPRDPKIPNGLRYHTIDIYVDELARLWESGKDKMPIETLLRPLRILGKKSLTKTIRERVKEALEDERLKELLGTDVEEQTAETTPEKLVAAESTRNLEEEDDWGGIED